VGDAAPGQKKAGADGSPWGGLASLTSPSRISTAGTQSCSDGAPPPPPPPAAPSSPPPAVLRRGFPCPAAPAAAAACSSTRALGRAAGAGQGRSRRDREEVRARGRAPCRASSTRRACPPRRARASAGAVGRMSWRARAEGGDRGRSGGGGGGGATHPPLTLPWISPDLPSQSRAPERCGVPWAAWAMRGMQGRASGGRGRAGRALSCRAGSTAPNGHLPTAKM